MPLIERLKTHIGALEMLRDLILNFSAGYLGLVLISRSLDSAFVNILNTCVGLLFYLLSVTIHIYVHNNR
jgi:hypothetical protein